MNEKMEAFKAKMKPLMQNVRKVSIIVVAMTFGFVACLLYNKLTTKTVCAEPESNVSNVHVIKETSVAINERNELMLIDRATGTYEIYEAAIGNTIFTMYANQMYSQKSK